MGTRLLSLQQQLFEHWHRWKVGEIERNQLRQDGQPIRADFEQTLRRVVELGHEQGEQTPWSQTVRTCQHLLQRQQALWTFLDDDGVEPTNNGAERALRPAVIQRKISHGVPSKPGALCAHACSRSAPASGNRAAMCGISWSRPGWPSALKADVLTNGSARVAIPAD